jgi:hypothetical protein
MLEFFYCLLGQPVSHLEQVIFNLLSFTVITKVNSRKIQWSLLEKVKKTDSYLKSDIIGLSSAEWGASDRCLPHSFSFSVELHADLAIAIKTL